jgi:hypothetical protein
VLLADLDEVDGPRESRLVRVRRITGGDGHAPRRIHPALGVVVYVLASHALVLMPPTDTQQQAPCRNGLTGSPSASTPTPDTMPD